MKYRATSLVIALFAAACLTPALAAAAKPPAPGAGPPAMPKTAPGTPTAAIRQLADAYEHESVDELAAVLTADYRFHPSEGESLLVRYMAGWDRARELQSLAGTAKWLDHIHTSVSGFESSADPEHPEAPAQYRVVVARDFAFSGFAPASRDSVLNVPADHVFYLVRGDAAVLAPGQSASRQRWYIRRWFENVRAAEAAIGKAEGLCDEAAPLGAAVVPSSLGLRAADSPLCPTLTLLCDLPLAASARLEVFDIAGRRLSERELAPAAAGTTLRVEAGSGQRFAPGAYFVRLSQGTQKPVSRMVLVAR